MTATIRPATEADIPALVALEAGFPPEDRFPVRTWRRLLRGRSAAYVAMDGEDVVAAAVYLFREGTKIARLYSLTVAPAQRGKGLARALMAGGEADAAARGCTLARLEVRQSNLPAIHLYERYGFRVLALSQCYYPDGETAVRMEKSIAPEESLNT
ncbi:MAG: N-acetyltransferase [Hyphomonas sp.]|uniref:GNAT family N-acetyltransferase n=1 Tax=Hyphomonas sp. TaxID=87 RepID=UPI00352862BB